MPREHNNRPRKPPTGKPSPEGFNEHDEATPGVDGEGLDLRAGQHKQELGRNPRIAPSPVNETMSRYKKTQAQKFAEHTPEAVEARNSEASPTTTSLTDAGQPNLDLQGSATASDWPVSFGEAKRKRSKKPKKPDKPKMSETITPQDEHKPPEDMPFDAFTHEAGSIRPHKQSATDVDINSTTPAAAEPPIDDLPRTADRQTLNMTSEKDSPLSHERPSPLKQERERLSHKRTPLSSAAPIAAKRRKADYRKNATNTAGENQTSQNATFDNSPKTSPFVHDTATIPIVASASDSDGRNLPADPTNTNIRELDTDADSLSRDAPRNTPIIAETKKPVKDFVQGKTHDPTLDDMPRRNTTPATDLAPQADVTPATPIHNDIAADANITADSSDAGKEHRATGTTDKPAETDSKASSDRVPGGGKKKGSKLQFDDTAGSSDSPKPSASSDSAKPSDSTKSGRQLETAERKVERSSKKLQAAKEKLPTKRKLRTDKEFDAEKGKMKPRLRFDTEVKTQHEHLKGPLVTRPLKFGANAAVGFAHTKVFQVQEENVGVKAAHKGEMLAEGGLRTAYRHHKLAPYRKVQKLEEKTRKLNVKAAYRKTLHDNPELRKKPLARFMQKRRIKREYAKAARDAKRAGTKVGATVKKTGNVIQRVTTALIKVVKSNPKVLAVLGLLFLLIVMLFGLLSSCASIASSVGQSFAAIAYLAEDECIDDASVFYSYLEADLRQQILNIEGDWPDINEFRMDIGTIGHCPFMLMAYLTAIHHDFTFAEIEDVLREIFAEQHTLEVVQEVEERRRWEQVGWEPDVYDWVYYDWYVLNVTLTSRSFFEVINARMDYGQRQHYALLMQSRGLRQIVLSPFDFYWMPFVSSHYGWRIHPISGNKQLHRGIDVALPTGTPILAATSGTVTFAGDMGGFGLVVFIDNGDGIITVYAHCDTLLVSTGQTVEAGDVIATVGSTGDSTGPHLHFEIIKNGRHLNPAFFTFSNTF